MKFISDFRFRPSLSAFCEHDEQSSTLQGGQIYCCTLLTPEIGMETFLKERGVSGPLKKSKNRRNDEYLKAQQLIPIISSFLCHFTLAVM
jgi:hypothetical protein